MVKFTIQIRLPLPVSLPRRFFEMTVSLDDFLSQSVLFSEENCL